MLTCLLATDFISKYYSAIPLAQIANMFSKVAINLPWKMLHETFLSNKLLAKFTTQQLLIFSISNPAADYILKLKNNLFDKFFKNFGLKF